MRPEAAALLLLMAAAAGVAALDDVTSLYEISQNPGERQRFNIHGPQPINTLSASWIEVSYRRLFENARLVLQELATDALTLAVVKGNAYGHGLLVCARAFVDAGFKELGVADLNEAVALRQDGFKQRIHVMHQPDLLGARVMAHDDVEVYVEDAPFLRVLCEETRFAGRESPMQVHVSVATRNMVQGARGYEGALHLARMVAACPSLRLRGLHSADGDLQAFQAIAKRLRTAGVAFELAHMGTVWQRLAEDGEHHLDLLHVDEPLYAVRPLVSGTAPAAQWFARVMAVKEVRAGDVLRADGAAAEEDMTVAVVHNGYLDGVEAPQAAFGGALCPRLDLGPEVRLAMFDVSGAPDVAAGDLALLHGCCDAEGDLLQTTPRLGAVSLSVPRVAIWG